ncbi:MAG: cell division protein ZapA [Flavobacteriaceae bacterium]|nr:cell division protein ZapA [Flavobacteriaceae bacterium]
MSNQLKIKLSIADRVYPLTIDPKQEESLRSAAKKIESMIKTFEKNYAVRDKQDVLAMCALQFASLDEQKNINSESDEKHIKGKLEALNNLVLNHLS